MAFGFWGQTVGYSDLFLVLLLIFFEGVLSLDNAIVLGLLARRLPKEQQKRALWYGMVGAFLFRAAAIVLAAYLLEWHVVKLLGGGYLLYIAVKHLFFELKEQTNEKVVVDADGQPVLRDAETGLPLTENQESIEIEERVPIILGNAIPRNTRKFWLTVAVIELTDIAFAVDSILAAIALVGSPPAGHPENMPHPKLWVIIVGGIIGIVMMRIAAVLVIRMLDRFPRFESAAYFLIIVISLKLLTDWAFNSPAHPHVIDFHDAARPEFWIFWIAMLVALGTGFLPSGKAPTTSK